MLEYGFILEVYQHLYGYNGVVAIQKILHGSIKYIVFFLFLPMFPNG